MRCTPLPSTAVALRTRLLRHVLAETCDAGDAFANELLSYTTDSAVLGPALAKIGEVLKQTHELQRAQLAQTEAMCVSSVIDPAKVEDDVHRVKDAKKRFVACDEEWRAALKRAHSVRNDSKTGKVRTPRTALYTPACLSLATSSSSTAVAATTMFHRSDRRPLPGAGGGPRLPVDQAGLRALAPRSCRLAQ